jgi:hypothetical protein
LESKNGRQPQTRQRSLAAALFSVRKSLGPSTPLKTRQTRQFHRKLLIVLGHCLSGSPKNPTCDPTNSD